MNELYCLTRSLENMFILRGPSVSSPALSVESLALVILVTVTVIITGVLVYTGIRSERTRIFSRHVSDQGDFVASSRKI